MSQSSLGSSSQDSDLAGAFDDAWADEDGSQDQEVQQQNMDEQHMNEEVRNILAVTSRLVSLLENMRTSNDTRSLEI